MKKLLIVVALIGALIAVGSAVTRAGGAPDLPNLSVSPGQGPPGFEFTMTVSQCIDGEAVTFNVGADAEPDPEEPPVEEPPEIETSETSETTCVDGAASADVTAPTSFGIHPVEAILDGVNGNRNDTGLLDVGTQEFDPCAPGGERPCRLGATILVTPPTLEVTPDSGEPEFEFTMTVEDCANALDLILVDVDPQRVAVEIDVDFFTFEGSEVDLGAIADEDIGVPCEEESSSEAVSKTFTAPDGPGVYPVLAVVYATEGDSNDVLGLTDNDLPVACDEVEVLFGDVSTAVGAVESCSITGQITVEQVDETTTTTTTIVVDVPTTTIAEDAGVPAPTEPPVIELPATGSTGNAATAALALLLLLADGAFVVIGTRRRDPVDER